MYKLITNKLKLNIQNGSDLLYLTRSNDYLLNVDFKIDKEKIQLISNDNDYTKLLSTENYDLKYVMIQLHQMINNINENIIYIIESDNIYINKYMQVKLFDRKIGTESYEYYETKLQELYYELTNTKFDLKSLYNTNIKTYKNTNIVIKYFKVICVILITSLLLIYNFNLKLKYNSFVYYVNNDYESVLNIKNIMFKNEKDINIIIDSKINELNINEELKKYFKDNLTENSKECWMLLIDEKYEQSYECIIQTEDNKLINFFTYEYIYYIEKTSNDEQLIIKLKESIVNE